MPERVVENTEMFVRSIQLPQQTQSYSPVSHGDIIDNLEQFLLEKELVPFKKRYITAKNGQEIYGDWILKRVDQTIENLQQGDTTLGIGFVNSYNKHLKLEITPGIRVLICGNGAMSKTNIATFERKHTGDINIEFPIFIQNSLENINVLFEKMNEDFNKLKEININKKLMSELAGRLFIQEEIISSEQMSLLKKEIISPTFSQFIPDNGYSFYNHCTYSIRNSHPSKIIDKYVGIHEFVMNNLV